MHIFPAVVLANATCKPLQQERVNDFQIMTDRSSWILQRAGAETTWPMISLLNYDSKVKLDCCPDNILKLQCTGPVINMPAIIKPLLGQDSFYSFFFFFYSALYHILPLSWSLHDNAAMVSITLLLQKANFSWDIAVLALAIEESPDVTRTSWICYDCRSLGQTARNSTHEAI